MARGVNRALIIGHLGQDPETRYTAGGSAVTNVSVATNETWKDKQGEKQERVEWHRIVMFGRLAEIAAEYLRKGSLVYLEGRLQTRKYEKDGQTHYSTEIVANELQMLGGGAGGGESRGSGGGRPQQDSRSDRRGAPSQRPQRPQPAQESAPDFDDDVPF